VRLSERTAAQTAPLQMPQRKSRTPGEPGVRAVSMPDVAQLAEELLRLLEAKRLKLVVGS